MPQGTRAQRAWVRLPEEKDKGHSGAIYRGQLMLSQNNNALFFQDFLYYSS